LEEFRKRKRSNFISHFIVIAFYIGLMFWAGPISFTLAMPLWFPVLLVLVEGINLYLGRKELKQLKDLRQKLELPENTPSDTDWKSNKNPYRFSALCSSLLAVLLAVLLVCSWFSSRLFDWEDRRWQVRAEKLPFATAEDLYPGSTFVPDEPWIIEEVDHVAERSTWLADRQIILNQNGSLSPANVELYLRAEYYDMRSEWLAKALYRELQHQAKLERRYDSRTIADLSTAREFAWQDMVLTCVLLQEGDRVLRVRLSQYDEQTLSLDTWAEVFANSIIK